MSPDRDIPTSRWPAWLNATALLLASVVAVAALSLQVRPGAEIVAVAFPPWWSARQIYQAAASADAAIVRTTALAAILVVRPNDRDGVTRLRQAGAWLTLDPQAIAACFNTPAKEI
ncbi:MAG: hypothetical protein Q7J60_13445 [Bradyrhizobium sp.]|uniref:hypothetical protein n=1 Tax=Bradyrhizobium sp. TaxID=376 RepID=UPI00271B35B1|nr:hypothetical protein [Bradyrhizobium sp.]MDO9562617.1 hypothetical protein [Bradyrhizobium sp.]MDP3693501.1 hypothetical protein [Bradyrhizobium sp.]